MHSTGNIWTRSCSQSVVRCHTVTFTEGPETTGGKLHEVGEGKEHSAWSPCSSEVTLKEDQIISSNHEVPSNDCQPFVFNVFVRSYRLFASFLHARELSSNQGSLHRSEICAVPFSRTDNHFCLTVNNISRLTRMTRISGAISPKKY